MDGSCVFNFTLERIPSLLNQVLQKNNLSEDDIDQYILHQANKFLLKNVIRKSNLVDSLVRSYRNFKSYNTNYFPNDIKYNWNEDNFGPIILPEKGSSIKLNPRNLPLYKKIIRDYEKNELTLLDGEIKINGKTTQEYTFKQDYYWMMGDNRYRSEDSRSWGFVPEDHIVGKPVFIWMSIEGINDGFKNWKIRWDRVFTTVNLDGEPKSYRWYFLIGILIVLGYSEFQKRKTKTK